MYEHERVTNVEFLENLVETYYEINEEIYERIDNKIFEYTGVDYVDDKLEYIGCAVMYEYM